MLLLSLFLVKITDGFRDTVENICIVCVWVHRNLTWWSSEECNMINGTNGASFHPVISKKERLYMFSSDLCRYDLLTGGRS